jgi:hypothetical protein
MGDELNFFMRKIKLSLKIELELDRGELFN